jgi:beta-lactamase regulating signal transducer with metallopeptidase domain
MFILYLLSLTLRSLILAALVGTALIFTKKVQSRHAAWTVVLCFLFLMPIADALLPAALVPASVPEVVRPIQRFALYAGIPSPQPVMDAKALPAAAPTDWWYIAAILMVSITAGFLVRLALVLREVMRLKRSSHAVPEAWTSSATNISVRESGLITIPLTIGVWKPVLMLPVVWRDWDEWKLRAVLTHERIHVERRDWMVAVIASVAKCLFWFNPLVWWLERKLSSLAEQASDEACVRACGDGPRYAETLLEFASAASRKNRLIGGVAMAQYRISQRIERVLALRRPGSGVLPRSAWVFLLILTLPALYVSAAAQSDQKTPALNRAELRQFFQPLLPPVALAAVPQTTSQAPAPQTTPPRETPPAQSPAVAPAPVQEVPPGTTQPDLVGEIKLILAPVDGQGPAPGQVQIQTRPGTTRYSGTAVWNVANNPVPPSFWNANTAWNINNATFAFALTGIEGRKALFEDRTGNTFSYGCPNCSFFVSQSGVGSVPANPQAGIAFQLSADGKLLAATCHASECRVASIIASPAGGAIVGGTLPGALIGGLLVNSQTTSIGIARSGATTCFNALGNTKADGTAFTDADCVQGTAAVVIFLVTR